MAELGAFSGPQADEEDLRGRRLAFAVADPGNRSRSILLLHLASNDSRVYGQ